MNPSLAATISTSSAHGWIHFPEQKPEPPGKPAGTTWTREYHRDYMREWYKIRYAAGLTSRGTPRKRDYHRNRTPEEKLQRAREWRQRYRARLVAKGRTTSNQPRKRPYRSRAVKQSLTAEPI